MISWPATAESLEREQERLAALAPDPWSPRDGPLRIGACVVVFERGGADETGWAAAVLLEGSAIVDVATVIGRIEAPFRAGQQALREGPILESAVRRLHHAADALLVAAAGRDHPRRAGLALQLGAVLDLPSVGVTERALLASGGQPARARGSLAPLRVGLEVAAYRVRTCAGAGPVVAHAGWRTTAERAAQLVLRTTPAGRWPEPLRAARRIARELRDERLPP